MNTKFQTQILVLCLCLVFLVSCQARQENQPAAPTDEAILLEQNIGGASSPQQTVEDFYTWYLDYVDDPSGDFRNPLVDKVYRESPYLSPEFIQKVDDAIAWFGQGGGFDPFLRAQDIPTGFKIAPGENENQVLLSLRFGESWHELEITLEEVEGRWLINDIQNAGQ